MAAPDLCAHPPGKGGLDAKIDLSDREPKKTTWPALSEGQRMCHPVVSAGLPDSSRISAESGGNARPEPVRCSTIGGVS